MELADVIDTVRPCIVQIAYTITGLEEYRLQELNSRGAVYSKPVGSGFVLTDKGEIVTAKHVLDDIERFAARVPEGGHIVGAGFAYPNAEGHGVRRRANFRIIKYEVVGTDDRNDLWPSGTVSPGPPPIRPSSKWAMVTLRETLEPGGPPPRDRLDAQTDSRVGLRGARDSTQVARGGRDDCNSSFRACRQDRAGTHFRG
jgi:hypothetical protein